MKIPKNKLGLVIISAYFVLSGLYMFHQIVQLWIHKQIGGYVFIFIVGLILVGSGIGLYLQKGWGWNFSLLSIVFMGDNGIQNLLYYFTSKIDKSSIIEGISNITLAICITMYLFKKTVRAEYPKSPMSLLIVGFVLVFWNAFQQPGNMLIGYLWLIMRIVGFALILRAGRQLRNNLSTQKSLG